MEHVLPVLPSSTRYLCCRAGADMSSEDACAHVQADTNVCVHVWLCMRAFRSTTLRPLADKYKTCDEQYEEIQAGLVDKVMSIIATYAPAVEALCELIADMDVLVALAHVASNAPTPYVRPTLTEAGTGDLVRVCRVKTLHIFRVLCVRTREGAP